MNWVKKEIVMGTCQVCGKGVPMDHLHHLPCNHWRCPVCQIRQWPDQRDTCPICEALLPIGAY
jgi:hypothetical protein